MSSQKDAVESFIKAMNSDDPTGTVVIGGSNLGIDPSKMSKEELANKLRQSESSNVRIINDNVDIYYGILEEDKALLDRFFSFTSAENMQAIINARKYHLLSHSFGNPTHSIEDILGGIDQMEGAQTTLSGTPYLNTLLHECVAMGCDTTVLSPLVEGMKMAVEPLQRTGDCLFRFYESQLKIAHAQNKESEECRNRVNHAILKRDRFGKTPLLLACKMVRPVFAMRLLALDEQRVTINIQDLLEFRTPLHIACILGLKDVILRLLELGADRNIEDRFGIKPLEYLSVFPGYKGMIVGCVLLSVNFFGGHYFNRSHFESVVTRLIRNQEIVKKDLMDLGIVLPPQSRIKLNMELLASIKLLPPLMAPLNDYVEFFDNLENPEFVNLKNRLNLPLKAARDSNGNIDALYVLTPVQQRGLGKLIDEICSRIELNVNLNVVRDRRNNFYLVIPGLNLQSGPGVNKEAREEFTRTQFLINQARARADQIRREAEPTAAGTSVAATSAAAGSVIR